MNHSDEKVLGKENRLTSTRLAYPFYTWTKRWRCGELVFPQLPRNRERIFSGGKWGGGATIGPADQLT